MTRDTVEPIVSLQHAVKRFGSFTAMSDGGIDLFRGQIHALAGENGAGKSTLVKVLAGIHRPNGGRLLLDGEPVAFKSTAESKAAGISVIYQEPTLFPDLSVAENIYVGRQPRGRRRGLGASGLIEGDVDLALNTPLTVVVGLAVAPQNEIRHDAVVSQSPRASPSRPFSYVRSAGSSMEGQSFHRRSSE